MRRAHGLQRDPDSVATAYVGHSGVVPAWLEGSTLSDRICLAGELSLAEVHLLAADLLGALVNAHEGGSVHGALHPDHVFLAEHQGEIARAVVTGFGAPLVDRDTAIGFVPGAFDPPERAATGPTIYGDLYSAAGILYFAASGAAPYTAPRAPEASFGPRLPIALLRVLVHAMSPDPAERYRSASELRSALGSALERPTEPR